MSYNYDNFKNISDVVIFQFPHKAPSRGRQTDVLVFLVAEVAPLEFKSHKQSIVWTLRVREILGMLFLNKSCVSYVYTKHNE